MPAKMAENLQIDLLAIFETYVIPISEGSLADEILKNTVVDIEGNIVQLALAAVIMGMVSITQFAVASSMLYASKWIENKVFENECKLCQQARNC